MELVSLLMLERQLSGHQRDRVGPVLPSNQKFSQPSLDLIAKPHWWAKQGSNL